MFDSNFFPYQLSSFLFIHFLTVKSDFGYIKCHIKSSDEIYYELDFIFARSLSLKI